MKVQSGIKKSVLKFDVICFFIYRQRPVVLSVKWKLNLGDQSSLWRTIQRSVRFVCN